MDFPTLVLIIIGATVVLTVMAAGGPGALLPRKPSAPADDDDPALEPAQAGRRPDSERRRAGPEPGRAAQDDPADNFFSDEDDYAFREPDYNRGAFSQREEDRDSLEDPDRGR